MPAKQSHPTIPPAGPNASEKETRLVLESSANAYISKKLIPQREWLDRKAQREKLLHYALLGISMSATTSIVLSNSIHLPFLTSALAVTATIATGAAGMLRSQENWVRYRNAANVLEAVKLKYEIGAPPFDGPDRHGLLIEEAERIFTEEQSQWAAKVSETVIHRGPIA